MLADYDFYKNTYKGIVIADANSYEYFGERAGDELALFSYLADTDGKADLQKCACAIADILYSTSSGGKAIGKNVTSESISGYYSVSYGSFTQAEIKSQINSAIRKYLGKYICGAKRVMW